MKTDQTTLMCWLIQSSLGAYVRCFFHTLQCIYYLQTSAIYFVPLYTDTDNSGQIVSHVMRKVSLLHKPSSTKAQIACASVHTDCDLLNHYRTPQWTEKALLSLFAEDNIPFLILLLKWLPYSNSLREDCRPRSDSTVFDIWWGSTLFCRLILQFLDT